MTSPQAEIQAATTPPQGWTPDKDDPRDFTLNEPQIRDLLIKSQATERLARILEQITRVLYGTKIPFTSKTLVNKNLLDDAQKEVEEISKLNSFTRAKLLTLVPAILSSTEPAVSPLAPEKAPASPPSLRTQVKVISEVSRDTQCLYIPILGDPQHWQDGKFVFPRKTNLVGKGETRIEDQGKLLSCTAHAAVALMEYFELQRDRKRCKQSNSDAEESQTLSMTTFSSRFLYKVTRTLYHQSLRKKGQVVEHRDTGAPLRDTLKAMLLFGVPPEEHWEWSLEQFDDDPPAFCYAYAKNYQALKYFRLDRPNMNSTLLLAQIKAALLAKFPAIFGFRIFKDDLRQGEIKETGIIPFPPTGDLDAPVIKDAQGNVMAIGHAVMAVGYDDDKDTGHGRKGALYFKNCWGKDWGKSGYGWLPYEYVLEATPENYLTRDWWTLIDANWAETEQLVGASFDPKKTIRFKQETDPAWVLGDEGSPFD